MTGIIEIFIPSPPDPKKLDIFFYWTDDQVEYKTVVLMLYNNDHNLE